MAQKESAHREVVDDLTTQLTQLRRQHDELTTLSRDQVSPFSTLSPFGAEPCVGHQHVF
jgi:hypothetical protein